MTDRLSRDISLRRRVALLWLVLQFGPQLGCGGRLEETEDAGQDPCEAVICRYGERCAFGFCVPTEDAGYDVGPPVDADDSTPDADRRPEDADRDEERADGGDDADGPVETGPGCGDGVLEWPEECDDGEDNSDVVADACREDCTQARCGDDVVDSGERCDGEAFYCDEGCQIAPPTGWLACQDALGGWSFFFMEPALRALSWNDARDWCVSTIEVMSPTGATFYGLAVLDDDELWDCVEPTLDAGSGADLWVGLLQDPDADTVGDTSPATELGWQWNAYDGVSWVDVAPFEPDHPLAVTAELDGTGGSSDADCARIVYDLGVWEAWDYDCDAIPEWSSEPLAGGICGIRF